MVRSHPGGAYNYSIMTKERTTQARTGVAWFRRRQYYSLRKLYKQKHAGSVCRRHAPARQKARTYFEMATEVSRFRTNV